MKTPLSDPTDHPNALSTVKYNYKRQKLVAALSLLASPLPVTFRGLCAHAREARTARLSKGGSAPRPLSLAPAGPCGSLAGPAAGRGARRGGARWPGVGMIGCHFFMGGREYLVCFRKCLCVYIHMYKHEPCSC